METKIMTREDKLLLLQDLCARLPYGVNIKTLFGDFRVCAIDVKDEQVKTANSPIYEEGDNWWSVESIKPYLRPMYSMTEEEKNEYLNTFKKSIIGTDEEDGRVWTVDSINYLNSHHFDFRNLIERGLAIEVTEENNPYKK